MDSVFKNVNGIIEAQIIQKMYGHIEVLIVPSMNFKEEVKVGNKLIRLCRNIYITLGELNWSILNRDKLKKHVETLGRSIQDNGLLKSIPVLPVNKDGKRNKFF